MLQGKDASRKESCRPSFFGFDFLVLLICFFPFLSFGANGLDSQPWPFLVAALFLMRYRDPRILAVVCGAGATFFGVAWYSGDFGWMSIRAIASYSTLLACFMVGLFVGSRLIIGAAIFSMVFYGLIGLLQALGYDGAGMGNSVRAGGGRGVASLAVEPTYFAITSMVLLMIIFYEGVRGRVLLLAILVCICNVVLLAISSMGILILFGLILCLAFYLPSKLMLGATAFFLAALFSVAAFFSESRAAALYESGAGVTIASDVSAQRRVCGVIRPLIYSARDGFGAHGFSNFHREKNGFWRCYGWHQNTVSSYFGSFIYELGFIGLVAVCAFFFFSIRGPYPIFGLFLLGFGFMLMPIAFSPFAILMGRVVRAWYDRVNI